MASLLVNISICVISSWEMVMGIYYTKILINLINLGWQEIEKVEEIKSQVCQILILNILIKLFLNCQLLIQLIYLQLIGSYIKLYITLILNKVFYINHLNIKDPLHLIFPQKEIIMPPKRNTILNFTLVLIQKYDQFDKIQPNRTNNHVHKNHNPLFCQSKQSFISDEDIIIPRCGKVTIQEQISTRKQTLKKSKKISGYKRLSFKQNLPNPFEYQLTDQDLKALQMIKKYHQANTDQQLNLPEQEIVNFIRICEDFQHSNMKEKRQIVSNQHLMANCFINLLHKQKSSILNEKLQNILCNIFRFWKLTKKQMNNISLLRTYWPRQETANHIYNLSIPFKIRRPHILQHHSKFSFQKFRMGIYKKGRKLKQNQNQNVINSLSQWCQLWQNYRKLRKNFVKYTKRIHSIALRFGYERPSYYKEVISKQFMKQKFQNIKIQQENKKIQEFSNYCSISNSTSDSIELIHNSYSQNKALEQENSKITRLTHDLQDQETLNQLEEYSILGSSQSTVYDKVIEIPSNKQMSLDQVFKKFSYKRIKRV